jgi:hypothetical protein
MGNFYLCDPLKSGIRNQESGIRNQESQILNPKSQILNFKNITGEMSEWLKEHAWKACVLKRYRGFESHSLR